MNTAPLRALRRAMTATTALALLSIAPGALLAQSVKPAVASAPTKSHKAMDLKAPPLTHIYPRAQLQYIMAVDDSAMPDNVVSVKGEKRGVVVPGAPGNQLQAIPWAFMHPTQAWRIFTPLQEP